MGFKSGAGWPSFEPCSRPRRRRSDVSTLTDTRIDLEEPTYLVEEFHMPKVQESLDENAELERERIDDQILEGLVAVF